MAQQNVYNETPNVEENDLKLFPDFVAQSKTEPTNKETTNTTGNDAEGPASTSSGGTNVTRRGKKKVKEFQFKNLEADVELTPTLKNLRIIVGMTVRIVGVGKWLTGYY